MLTADAIDDLARQAQDGDRAALETLLGEVRPRVLRLCRGMLPHPADAEDACQDALLAVTTRIGTWHRRGRFTTWLHVVALNSARMTYRRLKAQATPVDLLPDQRPDPRTTSVIAGTRLDLLEALDSIERRHPQYVAPLVLRDLYGLSYDEIAQVLERPLGSVKAHLHHARRLAQPMLSGTLPAGEGGDD